MKTLMVVSMLGAAVIMACSAPGKDIKKKDPLNTATLTLQETHWKLIELQGQPVTNPVNGQKEAYIQLLSSDNRLVGSGGCNSLSGSFALIEGNRIRFSGVASTRMACPDMSLEQGLSRTLDQTDSYALKGNHLTLHKAKMAPLAKFEAVRP